MIKLVELNKKYKKQFIDMMEEWKNTNERIIPYILKYCEVTNEKFSDVMNESINLVFYIVSYEILRLKEQEKQLKAIRNKNK